MGLLEGHPQKLFLFQLGKMTLPTQNGPLNMSLGCYLIQTSAGQNILIDTGLPPAGKSPEPDEKNVLEHLAALALQPNDIAVVITTHFDIDHVGFHGDFKNAEFIVQREHYELACSGHPRFAAGRPHWDHPALKYRLIDGDTELLPGLTLLKTGGHAPAHQSVLLNLPNTGFILLAIDAVVMERLFTPDRIAWPTDDNQEELRASTQKLLDVVKQQNVRLVVFGHDGFQWESLKKAPAFYD